MESNKTENLFEEEMFEEEMFEEEMFEEEMFEEETENEHFYLNFSMKYYINSMKFKDSGSKRDYRTLSEDELLNLIERAKNEKWEFLDLSDCGINNLPSEIGDLVDLRYLKLSNTFFKDGNGNYKNSDLERINTLNYLPKEIGNLKNLEELSLYSCNVKMLPKEISNLKKLKYLNINGSIFESFPMEIIELENLESLAISTVDYNLPPQIANFKKLEGLYLPDMKNSDLPEDIGKLSELKILYLGRANIESLPRSLSNLTNLKIINLENTPLAQKIPPEIFKQTASQIINYIVQYQDDKNKINLNESKMIIVGQGGVGKTTLLNKIINDSYIESPSTEGIDIEKWKFQSKNKEYTLNIWDFGGQEIYHSTHQFFLTQRSLYIFVWDARQEDEYGRIDYWLNTIQSFANDSPIIMVINKCDKDRKNIKLPDIDDLRLRFPQIVDCFAVSCLEDINIDILREEIIKEAKLLPLMETEWFSRWIKIREELELASVKRNIINYDEYLDLCGKYNLDEEESLSLIKYLHDLGVVLYFHNDELLKNLVILSPEWGTDAVYKILDSQANVLKNRNGVFYYKDLCEIWTDKEKYPLNMYPYILKLMENFELSFTIESNNVYLIPELLDNKAKHLDFNDENVLHFRYKYDFLPAGIMTKFIVKVHDLLMDKDGVKVCWRKGAYLNYQEAVCEIILKDDIRERHVDIKVYEGTRKARTELLAIVRRCFDSIHKNITKISLNKYIQCNCTPNCQHLHDYEYLLKLEKNEIMSERCRESMQEINIYTLLDGIKVGMKNENKYEINVSPVFNNNPVIRLNTQNLLSNENTITIEVKNSLNDLLGNIRELQLEVPEAAEDIEKMANALEKIESSTSAEEIVKSGALNRVKRVLEELGDSESSVGKMISGAKYGYDILQDIAKNYNKVAEWCGMPVVPKFFLKK